MRKLTNKEFLDKLHSLKGNDYEPLEEYKGATTKIKFRCNKCGNILYSSPDKIYNGGCIKCGYKEMKRKQRKTNEAFLKEVTDLVGDRYTFIDKYVNNITKLKVKHNECGHVYYVTPRDFLSGRRCPNCKGKRISSSVVMSHEAFMNKLNKVLESDYEILSEYKNAKTKIKVRHNKCGSEYEVFPHKLIGGNRCRYCVFKEMGEKQSKSHEVFINEIFEKYGSEYEVLENYVNNRTKLPVRHSKCGYIYDVRPDEILRGNGCPKCKESKGEKELTKIFKKLKIENEPQYKFDDCVYKDKLRFDFAIFKDNKIVALIEYQGIQHYKPVERFGGINSFNIQCEKDSIKREYAKKNNIPLIEIPYFEKDIESYLINELSKSIPR